MAVRRAIQINDCDVVSILTGPSPTGCRARGQNGRGAITVMDWGASLFKGLGGITVMDRNISLQWARGGEVTIGKFGPEES